MELVIVEKPIVVQNIAAVIGAINWQEGELSFRTVYHLACLPQDHDRELCPDPYLKMLVDRDRTCQIGGLRVNIKLSGQQLFLQGRRHGS